ncbi:MAG: hypothetical protein J5604_06305 [Bacteroidales bacterium]|nr:hypothetical protein [Bacteroidales bacterium]
MSFEELYLRDGVWMNYFDLSPNEKLAVRQKKRELANEIFTMLKGTIVNQVVDRQKKIEIHFTKKGINHFCNDAIITLSGRYLDENSMKKIDEILSKAMYLPTPHTLSSSRNDGRILWFVYIDADRRGVYFKVCWNKNLKVYEFYSVVNQLKK